MPPFGSNAESCFVALIGDVVESRTLPDRAAVQRALSACLAELNRTCDAAVLASRVTLTAGDEVQALFWQGDGAVEVVRRLADAIVPARIVFGLGRGRLTTELAANPAVLDGPCFHRARAALGDARRHNRWAVARGFGSPRDEALSALFGLLGVIRERWTATQARYVEAARSALQKDVAAAFQVSPSVVSESLKAAAFDVVLEGEAAARVLLAEVGASTDGAADSAPEEKQ